MTAKICCIVLREVVVFGQNLGKDSLKLRQPRLAFSQIRPGVSALTVKILASIVSTQCFAHYVVGHSITVSQVESNINDHRHLVSRKTFRLASFALYWMLHR